MDINDVPGEDKNNLGRVTESNNDLDGDGVYEDSPFYTKYKTDYEDDNFNGVHGPSRSVDVLQPIVDADTTGRLAFVPDSPGASTGYLTLDGKGFSISKYAKVIEHMALEYDLVSKDHLFQAFVGDFWKSAAEKLAHYITHPNFVWGESESKVAASVVSGLLEELAPAAYARGF